MAQHNTTVNDLINEAYYLIGEVSPDTVPTASMVDRGLGILNRTLDSFASLGVYIPYIKAIDISLTAGKNSYSISDVIPADFNFNRIVELDFVTINYLNTNYPIRVVDRSVILNQMRFPTAYTRPSYVYMDNLDLQTNLVFYPAPDLAYDVTVRGKFMLKHFELFEVITEIPPKYFELMVYALGRKLRSYYPSGNWTREAEDDYQTMLKNIKSGSEINIMINPDPILMTPWNRNYNNFYPWGNL